MVVQHNIFLVLLSSAVIGKLTPLISKVGYYLKNSNSMEFLIKKTFLKVEIDDENKDLTMTKLLDAIDMMELSV